MIKLNTDRVVSLTAMLIGVGSLFVILYQTHLARQSQRASVLPYLSIVLTSNDAGVFLAVGNVGIGPALIQDVRVRYRGKEIRNDPYEFFTGIYKERERLLSVDKIQEGRLIPAGYNVQMLGVTRSNPVQADQMLKDTLSLFQIAEVPRSWYADLGVAASDKAVIEITYSSVYGDRWRIRSDQIVPEGL
jgi:hypothetical protein